MAETGRLAGAADEGGWWPMFASNEDAGRPGRPSNGRPRPGEDVFISLDVAANELHADGRYRLGLDGADFSSADMVARVADWVARYPILSIEDPVSQDDVDGFALATRSFGATTQLIGDDILVTDAERVRTAAAAGAGNAVLVKVNQAGTLSRAKAALDAAKALNWGSIVSARPGETEDVAIAHLAVGWDAGQIKVGSFARPERMAKWNELLRIEEAMGADAVFAGASALAPSVAETLVKAVLQYRASAGSAVVWPATPSPPGRRRGGGRVRRRRLRPRDRRRRRPAARAEAGDAATLAAGPKLKLVQKLGVGVNTIDLEACKAAAWRSPTCRASTASGGRDGAGADAGGAAPALLPRPADPQARGLPDLI